MRIHQGEFFADILRDNRNQGVVYHFVVQRTGSSEILDWGQEPTEAEAVEAAKRYLELVASHTRAFKAAV